MTMTDDYFYLLNTNKCAYRPRLFLFFLPLCVERRHVYMYIVILCPQTVFALLNVWFDSCLSLFSHCSSTTAQSGSYQWFFSHILAVCIVIWLSFAVGNGRDGLARRRVSIVCASHKRHAVEECGASEDWGRCQLFSFKTNKIAKKKRMVRWPCAWPFALHWINGDLLPRPIIRT